LSISMWEQSYSEAEEHLLSRIRPRITTAAGAGDAEVAEIFHSMEINIRRLSEVFYGYPSILDSRGSGEDRQTVRTLVEALFHGGIDHTVLLPTKVVVGRSFMIAKFNLFGYLRKLCDSHGLCREFQDELQECWETIIFSLLLEDVYQVIIERGAYDTAIRRHAAMDLIHLWEHRFDQNVTEYAPTLIELWSVRRRLVPVFGTMMGTMELLRLSSLLPDRWYGFLERHGDEDEVIHALEEFIFGLSYEDLCRIREDMMKRHLSVIDRQELGDIPGIEVSAEDPGRVDPREMYRFYQSRTRRAAHRGVSGATGPQRTLEEYLLVDFIVQRRAAGVQFR
jgi:hypothetical protein